jgi:hypothetical protein
LDNLDTYTGILLGFRVVSSKVFNDYVGVFSPSSSRIIGSWYIGGRYYFNDKLDGMLELGYGISYINLGVALKLN